MQNECVPAWSCQAFSSEKPYSASNTLRMKARVTLGPEHRRARKLRQRFGDQLVYVRDRYDEERKKQNTTVELIIDEAEWEPRR
ncbi:MAG: hypothetical protein GY801_31425, partial [bacterium]|nr:hypothetical protein [bacterium]